MRTAGVICEFNPFHNGHARILEAMREATGPEGCVICLMSGRFVQRGTAAMADPYLRARMALEGGADLVLELPYPWSAASAEHFAAAGVRILTRLGVDMLAFGSECGDKRLLTRVAHAISDASFGERYAAHCRRGIGTTAAFAAAIHEALGPGECPDDFPASNDFLGLAYLRELLRIRDAEGIAPGALVVHREGAAYRDDMLHADALPSATALRRVIFEAASDPTALETILQGTMPDRALTLLLRAVREGDAPVDGDVLLPFFHGIYRLPDATVFEKAAELGGGLAGHVSRCARTSATPAAFMEALRTKQYTDARLRRALLFGATEVHLEDLRSRPTYTTLLAANERGCTFLGEWQKANRDKEDFAVVTKPADAPEGRQSLLCARADALFTLCYPAPTAAGDMLRRTPYINR